MQRRAPRLSILSLRWSLRWWHSFQFSPRFRLITATSLRLPLSDTLIRYPLHFTAFSVPPFSRLCPLCLLFCCLPPPPFPPLLSSVRGVLKGSPQSEWWSCTFLWMTENDVRFINLKRNIVPFKTSSHLCFHCNFQRKMQKKEKWGKREHMS